jgi:hypothetical protein
MQTVIETPAYLASVRDIGLSDEERDEIVSFLARHPDAGDLMPGTGGARKLRFAGRSKGRAEATASSRSSQPTTFPFFCSMSTARMHAQISRKLHAMSYARC